MDHSISHCFLGPCHYANPFLFSVNLLFVKRTVLKEINYWFSADYVVIAHFLICQEANNVCGKGGELEASDDHNVSNVKIDTYIITSRLRSTHLNMIWHLDDMAFLFDQAVNDSQSCWKRPRNVMNTNSRTSTLVNITLNYMPYIKWKSLPKITS